MKREVVSGGVCAPKGFAASSVSCGIRDKSASRRDLALVYSDAPAAVGAVYTTNLVKAAPLTHTQRLTRKGGSAHAVMINSGNANACNGPDGKVAVRATVEALASALECKVADILVASTGAIGVPFPTERVLAGIDALAHRRDASQRAAKNAAEAIMTTDVKRKEHAVRVRVGGKVYTVGGMAKGSGMIHPNMATMLGVITTDAPLSGAQAQRLLRDAVARTFNCISVDGDTSTNDCVFLLANGAAGGRVARGSHAEKTIANAIETVAAALAESIAADGEGAKKLLIVEVRGAKDAARAQQIARTVITSPLVKTAVAGGDPNWGRVLAAAGRAGVPLDPDSLALSIGGYFVAQGGVGIPKNERPAARHLRGKRIEMVLQVGTGKGEARALGCDLTHGYVDINAHYRT